MMMKYFHGGIDEIVLFKTWITYDLGSFVGTWFAIFAFSFFFEFFKTFRSIIEINWRRNNNNQNNINKQDEEFNINQISSSFLNGSYPRFSYKDLIGGVLYGIETGMSLILMLIVMLFNTALFFSILMGIVCGNICFGRFNLFKPKSSCC
ncbi:hypothetical protein RB653_006701 [Dictyostelium firmibasis]|uniref:Copper transport protein n=1 Tax=Dictyostelium firmibasis TaxID=79012 RepID=A0AAN7U2M2_9MYCE